MTLYDRICEAMASQSRHHRPATYAEKNLGPRLLHATVYEISNVVPLFDDWERDRCKPIPKRAPHEITWCEWSEDEVNQDVATRWRIGVLISETPRNVILDVLGHAKQIAPDWPLAPWRELLAGDELFYAVQPFKLIESSTDPDVPQPRNIPWLGLPGNIFAFKTTGEYVGGSKIMPRMDQISKENLAKEYSIFGLPVLATLAEEKHSHHASFWPPFMAFSLMHCKNVAVESHQPDEKTQRRVKRSGNPPRSSWRTISIRVPETLKPRHNTASVTAEPSVRFHLCRGHFKNLQHPKFKSPGLHWWPAHWRGDPDAGVVITDRVLEPKT